MLCHDGTLEGFLCCVFDAYALHMRPRDICDAHCAQPALGQRVIGARIDISHAERVREGMVRQGGRAFYRQARTAFLSDEPGRELAIFDYIVKVMDEGCGALSDIACPCVARTGELVRGVLNERERVYQFLRFEEVEGGAYVARIAPRANVVPIMMRHFVERFGTRRFLIYDEGHGIAGVFDGRRYVLARTDRLEMPDKTCGELQVQRLWKTFYDAISNEQRYDPDLRRSLMPERFWRFMPEMRMAVEGRAGSAPGQPASSGGASGPEIICPIS